MRAAYLDTSVLVVIAFGERGASRWMKMLRATDRLYSSTLLEAEFLATAEREGVRDRAAPLLRPIRWIFPDRRLTAEISQVLELGYVRGADLHHLASALYLFPNPAQATFLSADRKQQEVAETLGFRLGGS